MELLVGLLIFILVIGLLYWLASQLLPHPFPLVILVVGIIVLLLWLVGNVGEFDFDSGRR